MTKPRFTPSLSWVANAAGQMTGEAQRILRSLIEIVWNRTGLETSAVVTGTAGTAGNLSAWNSDGDLVDANAAVGAMPDNTFRIVDNGDPTKKLAFEVSGIATATTRTWTVPNANVTVTAFAATLLDDADAATARGTLELATSTTDNAVARYDSTAGKTQNSAFIVDDSGHVSSFGGNIKFPAAQVQSSDANTLDDYEEGTFTPSLGGNATYNTQAAKYGKVGSYVYISIFLHVNVIGTGSTTTISGLPYTSAGFGTGPAIAVSKFGVLALSPVFLAGFVTFTATTLTFNGLTAAAASTTNTMAIFGSSASIQCSGWYFIDP